ncbi:cytidine and dCMP deaminase domain-containing protein 1-like isoform X2 [Eublepharis macularius]|uniref:dCMP deaminase n=1 Tax=Eublepharis macularius TaxID=481883 RepID=A0AA97L695_EUBMA|nr:cytidine and dCMP deaminase domain-containing protein 1-like isoform X2 [Eublepharis macularius]
MSQNQEREAKETETKINEASKIDIDELKPPLRLKSKKDLFMCLALHMENSPMCEDPEGDFYKSGIVICESDKVHKVVAMCCSTKSLHAVQRVLLNTHITLRNCTVYLSRKPCSSCSKFLVQGEISAVYYWPRHPELKQGVNFVKKDLYQVDHLFLRSSVISSVFVPLEQLDKDTVSKLVLRTKRYKCPQCKPNYEETRKENYEINCDLLDLQDCRKTWEKKTKDALKYLNDLLHCSHGKFEEGEPSVMNIHALQLCYLLAARSDDPFEGVGCILYNENGFFFGAGYNGYPIGALYGNLPRHGRAVRSYPAKKSALIHAEANALLFRFKNIGDKDILYCSKLPCSDCQKYIEFVGIKKIVSTEKCCYITHNKWNQVSDRSAVYALQAGSNDQGANNSVPKGDVEGKAVSSCRLEKSEMCLFLAIHMENSPYCESPKGTVGPGSSTFKFCKTGIVICEGDKFQRIIAMDCSSKSLHAVQKVLLRLPNELRGCNVYLSRKPCIDCVKFLVQAQVRNIFFWPSLEIDTNTIKANKETFENQSKLIGNILKESCTYDAMFVPLVDGQSETKGAPISSIFECPELKTILDASSMSFLNEKEYQSAYKEEVKKAQNYIQMLTGNKNKKLLENNFHEILECEEEEEYIQHALQLCKFLAARSVHDFQICSPKKHTSWKRIQVHGRIYKINGIYLCGNVLGLSGQAAALCILILLYKRQSELATTYLLSLRRCTHGDKKMLLTKWAL